MSWGESLQILGVLCDAMIALFGAIILPIVWRNRGRQDKASERLDARLEKNNSELTQRMDKSNEELEKVERELISIKHQLEPIEPLRLRLHNIANRVHALEIRLALKGVLTADDFRDVPLEERD